MHLDSVLIMDCYVAPMLHAVVSTIHATLAHKNMPVSSILRCSCRDEEDLPIVPQIESLKRADEIDVASKAADPVVPQAQMLELCQRFQIIRDDLDSEPLSQKETTDRGIISASTRQTMTEEGLRVATTQRKHTSLRKHRVLRPSHLVFG